MRSLLADDMRVILSASFLAILAIDPRADEGFKSRQSARARVRSAAAEKGASIRDMFARKGLSYPPKRIFIRVLKFERVLELWVSGQGDRFELLKEYRLCATSGGPGPKRQMGDGQIPEGFYSVDRFNPVSNFHLSLGINYPNKADRINGVGGRLGGDIFIHGGCVTIGCIPITDDGIKELYLIAVEARSAGQSNIPVHIFPARLNQEGLKRLQGEIQSDDRLRRFWLNLKEGFEYFESHRRLPEVSVDGKGHYVFRSR